MRILLCTMVLAIIAGCTLAGNIVFPSFSSSEPFDDVLENVKDAIINRGMNISNTLPAGEMLNKTGADLGHPENVYIQAQTIEFCSAKLSHQLVAANPNNMVLCPFTISVYQLTIDPDTVYVAYRTPIAGDDSKMIIAKVEMLIQEIIQEAIE